MMPHPQANITPQQEKQTHDSNDQKDDQLEEDHATEPPT